MGDRITLHVTAVENYLEIQEIADHDAPVIVESGIDITPYIQDFSAGLLPSEATESEIVSVENALVTAVESNVLTVEYGSAIGVKIGFSTGEDPGFTVGDRFDAVLISTQWSDGYRLRSFYASDFEARPDDCDISGWTLVQAEAAHSFTFPENTVIPGGGYLVLGRNADEDTFEAAWGIEFGSNAVYVNSEELAPMPMINGDETFTLFNAEDTPVIVDGPTIALTAHNNYQRISAASDASSADSWMVGEESAATPGSGIIEADPENSGPVISEFSDSPVYAVEFVELYCN